MEPAAVIRSDLHLWEQCGHQLKLSVFWFKDLHMAVQCTQLNGLVSWFFAKYI